MACRACGAPVEDASARFCEDCGSPLPADASRRPTPTAPVAHAASSVSSTSSVLPYSFGAGRYEVRRFLGEGGRKRVYQAYDRALDRDVAVATLKTEDLDTAGLERVRREAQAMGRLGDHPHIVTVYDIGDEAGRPFIISEYMSGGSVDDLLAGTPERRLDVADAVRIADEICQALEHAHGLGIVHRDIKPANVWLTDGGSTRLGDFGLAAAAGSASRSRLTKEGMMVGTVAYMAPEQALGQDIDARADLYSLGALLYELLTGRPPFVGPDAVAVISQQINTPPMAPWWHNPAVPKELGTLVLELLAKTPEDRPPSATDVRRRLSEVLAIPGRSGDSPSPEVAPAGGRHTARLNRLSRFVGRADELRDLKRAVEAALQGRGGMVMVGGEPGIGKSRLAEEAGVYARLAGGQVLVGRAYEAESSVSYMPFIEALRSYVASRPADALREELGDGGSDVAKLVSDVHRVVPDLPATSRPHGEEERYRLFESVCSFLVNASRSNPILLLLDDLHWADAGSLRLLQHLSRRLADSRLLVVGTYRDVELSPRHPLAEALAELRREQAFQRIVLRGLSLSEVQDFLEGLTERPLEPEEQPLAAAFYGETEGNPYFLEEVVRHLLETGGAFWEEGRWRMDVASVESLAVPDGIRELVARRLSRLSETANNALTRAAVLGQQFDFAVVGHMTGLDEDALLAAIEEALAAQLIEQAPTQHGHAVYRFTHAVIRQSLYEAVSLPRRQRLHRRAAEAIEAVHARNLDPHLPALALQYRQAGAAADADRAVEYAVRAGEAARAVFAYEDAVHHWEAALEVLTDAGSDAVTEAVLLARLGDLQFISGVDYERSTACLERAVALYQQLGMPERVAQMHSRLGRNKSSFPWSMDLPAALSHYRAAEALVGGEEGSALGYVVCGRAGAAAWAQRTEEGLEASDHALAIAAAIGNDRLRRHAAAQYAHHVVVAGRLGEGFAGLEATWVEADATRDSASSFQAAWVGMMLALDLDDPAVARAWYEREAATARLSQAPYPRRLLLDALGRAEATAGDLAAARRARDEAGQSRYSAPIVALREGRFDEAAALWEALRDEDRRTGNRRDEWVDTFRLGMLARLDGNLGRAEALLREALEIATSGGQRIQEVRTRAEMALVLADAGFTEEARGQVARAADITSGGEDWRGLEGRVILAEAAVLVSEGRVGEAPERFAAAADRFRSFGLPWDEAEAQRRWAQARLRVGDRTGAVQKLAAAIDLYRRHGAGSRWIEPLVAEKLAAQGVEASAVLASVHLVAAAVEEERPDLAPHASPEGTVTLLFSDIEGSTAANERLGDRRWMEVLRAHNQIVRQEVARHGGFEVKSQGDGFMVAFSSAQRALASAVAIQRALRVHGEAQPEEAINVRMGLHTGEAVKEGDDFFGTHVALAARIASAARGGEILVSSLLRELTESSGDLRFGAPRDVELKGFSGTRPVYPLCWEDAEPAGTAAATRTLDGTGRGGGRLVTVLATDGEPASAVMATGVANRCGDVAPLKDGVAVFASAADAVSNAARLVREQPSWRVGLHTGTVPDEAAAGGNEPVATARALRDQARPGQVLCSRAVASSLTGRPRFTFTALDGAAAGGPDAGTAYEARPEWGEGPFSAPVTLIGREGELARVSERIHEAAAGRGGLVMLAGEQGIGKTRLADEIATCGEREGFSVLWGRCHEGEWPPPYGPFVEALETLAGLVGDDDLRADLGDGSGLVGQLLPGLGGPAVAAATAVPPEEQRHRLVDGVARLLVRRSRRRPVLVMLDDLHWADRSTIVMLRYLARLAARERVLVVGTYRDVDLDRSHPLVDALAAWSRESGYDQLTLHRLDGDDVTALLSAACQHDVDTKVGAAWARETGGNAFYILELLRHLYEEGRLYRGVDGRWTTTARLRDLALPAAARDVAVRRLSRLSETANRLLAVAAAFQGTFRFEVVAGLAGLSEDEGLDALEEAVGARILDPSGDTESYAFTHAVIRHALYDRLVPSRRSRLHRRVAEALEGASTPCAPGEVAIHYHRSIALPGAERGVEPALAAADGAQGSGGYDQAAAFLRMALDMLPGTDTRRPRVLGRLGIVLAWALEFDEAVAIARDAGDAIAEAETKQAAAEYLADAAYACASAGGVAASWALARAGLGYAGERDVSWARLVCFDYQRREAEDANHPGIPVDSPERREAAAILRAARLDAMGFGPMEAVFDSHADAAACSNLMVLAMWAGEHSRVLPLAEAEAREAERLGRLSRAARAWAVVSYSQGALGQLGEARRSLERGRGIAARTGTTVGALLYPQYLLCTALDDGWEDLAGTFAFLRSSPDPALAWLRGFAYTGSALAAAHLGDVEGALGYLGDLTPWLELAPPWSPGFSTMACGASQVLWRLERTDHLDRIERSLREKVLPTGFRFGLADPRLSLAWCCALTGRHDEARRWFADARLRLSEDGATPLLAICDFDEALMYARRHGAGDADAARPLVKVARSRFEDIGMAGWIPRAADLERSLA